MDPLQKRLRPLLGTFVELGAPAEEAAFVKASDNAFKVIEKVQKLLSFHDPQSELSKLNQSVNQEIFLDPISVVALKLARYMTKASGGLFDLTLADQLVRQKYLPDHAGPIVPENANVGDIYICGRNAILQKPLRLSLDGIAKGYAVDLAVKELKAQGLTKGYVNAGGDLRVFGDWVFPVHRRSALNEFEYLGDFKNTAIATSAVHAIDDSRFPGKIVSSKDSVMTPQIGIFTVQSSAAWLSDALTKVVCIASSDLAQKIVSSFGAQIIYPQIFIPRESLK